MVIYLQRGADLHTGQLMRLPLTVSCFSKIQIGFTFLVLAHPHSPGQRAIKRMYTVIHNYGNPYEKWNIFVVRPHLWLQLGMVKPEIML